MDKIYEKYKSLIFPLILIAIYAIFIYLTWGKWGHIIYDCFREATIPQAILDGKILYRDILNLYPPLAYQFNAVLYFIFGNSLNTLYWAGIINSFLILSVIYFMTRRYSSDLISFIVTLSIMEVFVFKLSSSNTTATWFFPYSYSFIYSFLTCLLSLLACNFYRENKKPLYLYLSFLFAGLSVAFKFDFLLFSIVPLYYLIKNKSLKSVLISIGAFILPLIISFLIYFITGGTIFDIQNEINFLINFSKAPSVIAFNKEVMPQAFSIMVLKNVFISFKYFILIATLIFSYSLFSLFVLSKVKNIFLKTISGIIFFLFGFLTVIQYGAFVQYSISTLHTNLSFVSYIVTISAILIFILKAAKNKGFKNLNFTREEGFYFFITFCAMLISFRSYASLHISNIGNFMIAIWWINFVYLFLKLLPSYFPDIFKKDLIKKSFYLLFVLYGFCFTYLYLYEAGQMTYKLSSKHGAFYGGENFIPTINETINFIEENIPYESTFLVMEEGVVLNYVTNREMNLKYYALIPHMVDTFGEENIILDLNKIPPEYLLVTNNIYVNKKLGGVFGINYARKIAKFIVENYNYIKTIKNPKIKEGLEITVFKLKNKY